MSTYQCCLFGFINGVVMSLALADMTVVGYSSARHDRFYPGSDRAFLAEGVDFSGVGRPSNANDAWATLISPSFFVSAKHWHPAVGDTLRFYYTNNRNGGYEERTVIGGYQPDSDLSTTSVDGDVWIGRLSAPVSSRVAKYALLDNVLNDSLAESNLLGQKMWEFGRNSPLNPSPIREAVGRNTISGVNRFSVSHGYETIGQYGTLGQDEALAIAGDSGSPAFITINNQPVLLGARWTGTSSSYNGSVAGQINSYISTISGGTESATFITIPQHTNTPILRETFQADAINSAPKGGDQTFKKNIVGQVTIAGSGGIYADPFGGNGNKSLRLQASSSVPSSSVFFEGFQTGVRQGRLLMDFYAHHPTGFFSNALLFDLLIGHDYYGDNALDKNDNDSYEAILKLSLQNNGRLLITSKNMVQSGLDEDSNPILVEQVTHLVSDQSLEFNQSHHVEIVWRSLGTSDSYADVLIDGQKITANSGQISRFELTGQNEIDRLDAAYLTMDWFAGLDDPIVYFDNLYLLDIPEPTSIIGLGAMVAMMFLWKNRV